MSMRFIEDDEEPPGLPDLNFGAVPSMTLEESFNHAQATDAQLAKLKAVFTAAVFAAQVFASSKKDTLLTQEEIMAINCYTQDSSFYKVLDARLNDSNRDRVTPFLPYLKILYTAISKLPTKNSTVFRGVKLDLSLKYGKGKKVKWWALTTCARDPSAVKSEPSFKNTSKKILFQFEEVPIVDLNPYTAPPRNNEVLLLPGISLKSSGTSAVPGGYNMVTLVPADRVVAAPVETAPPPETVTVMTSSPQKSEPSVGGSPSKTPSLPASSSSAPIPDPSPMRVVIPRKQDGVAAVIQAMRNYAQVPEVQQAGCKALADLSSESHTNTTRIAEADGIELIVEAMREFPDNVELKRYACLALGNLADDTENQIRISECQGIEAVLEAMNLHATNPGVQDSGCYALGNLADDEYNQVRIAELDGIQTIVRAMNRHAQNANVADNAIFALGNLADDEENQLKIVDSDGIEAIVKAMKKHHSNPEVQKWGCLALGNLASDDDNMERIVDVDGIEMILKAVRKYPGHIELQKWGILALGNLAADEPVRVAAGDGIELIVRAMRNYPVNSEILRYCCNALWSIAAISANKARIMAAEGIELVTKAMKAHPQNPPLQLNAILALSKLAHNNPECQDKIASLQGIDLIMKALKIHAKSDAIQKTGTKALQELSK